MSDEITDIAALVKALDAFSDTTRTMEEAYRRLEARVDALDRELAEKNHALALSTEYLSSLLESMSDGVIAIDTEGRITRFNRAAHTILGYAAAEIAGQPFREIFGREFAAPRLSNAMELRAKSGRMVPVSERDSPICDNDNRRLGNVKTFQDLSELTALRAQVRQIDRLAAIGEMAATVAHEIRNPLGGIRGFATFLAQDTPPEDPRRRLIDKILEGARSLDKVVGELLEYTRPVDLTLRPARCAAVIEEALSFLDIDPDRIGVRIEVDPDLKILADAEQIKRVLLNILLNSVQSIEEQGEIGVTAQAESAQVALMIRDNGCGMSEDTLQRIFNPFFSTKEKGTGLGLAISMRIIEGHGGEIEATSEAGAGTTISIRLPRSE
jgi:PAS domain S-box-containing protein